MAYPTLTMGQIQVLRWGAYAVRDPRRPRWRHPGVVWRLDVPYRGSQQRECSQQVHALVRRRLARIVRTTNKDRPLELFVVISNNLGGS